LFKSVSGIVLRIAALPTLSEREITSQMRLRDRLHLAADGNFRRGLVVGDDDVVLAAVA
jgi:hypothetical protein